MSDEAISSLNGRHLHRTQVQVLLRRGERLPRNDMQEAAAQALDLCLACKGCKAECPSGVDMAKLKFAFQAEYYKTHRRQLRDYVFGYFHIAAALASSVAPFSNAMMEIPLVKNLVARILGITDRRPFPKFSNSRSRLEGDVQHGKKIVFLPDAFSRYIEPQVEQAAFDILSKCGYDVHILPVIGAGASFLSKGFVDESRRHAGKVLDALDQIDPAREVVIVGIEPPEIYCLKHDYIDLLPDREAEIAQRIGNVWLLDEYLVRSDEFNILRVVTMEELPGLNDTSSKKLRFHPHCHQRAEGLSADGLPTGTNATVELLQSCGYDVELMDTGCCGMAGTFGYEAEHYELSMRVGELKLFPQLRTISLPLPNPQANIGLSKESNVDLGEVPLRSGAGGVVVSSGAACRMQIQQGTGVNAIHPIMLIAKLLNEGTTNS